MKVLVLFGLIAVALAAPVPDAEADNVVVAHHAAVSPYAHFGAVGPLTYAAGHYAHAGVAPVAYAAHAGVAPVSYAAHTGVAPVSYAAHAGVAPLTYAAHAGIAPVSYAAHAGVAPVSYAAHAGVAPVSYAGVAPVSYAAAPAYAVQHRAVATPVALPPAEVKVPVTTHHVEVPVHQRVQYGTQAYVAGATTTIHKPSLTAPAIAPPSTLLAKVHHNAPEVTLKTQEIPVERHTPNFVDTPYHAGTIVKYTEPEIRVVKVPTPVAQPVAVPHPVPYAAPYAVPQAVPVPHAVHSLAVHHPVNYVHHAAATVVKSE